MNKEVISRRLRGEFEDYLTSKTLKEIERYFDNYNIPQTPLPANKIPSGQRRALVLSYYNSIDWTNSKEATKVLKVFNDVLLDLQKDAIGYDKDLNKKWIEKLNEFLNRDSFNFTGKSIERIGETTEIIELAEGDKSLLDTAHFNEYVERIKKSIDADPPLAIGSTKELLESLMKTILSDAGVGFDKNDDIPKLIKKTQQILDLLPDNIDNAAKGADTIKVMLSNLGQLVVKISELRNIYGTGHGHDKTNIKLKSRHARLVVGSGVTLANFFLELYIEKKSIKHKAANS